MTAFPVTPLRRVAQGGGLFTDGDWVETPFITDDGIRLIQTGNVGVGVFREQGFRYISNESFFTLNCTEVLPGDLLISRLADPVGRSCIAPDLGTRMITSVDVAVLRPRPGSADTRFLNYYLSSSRHLDAVAAIARGGTRERISREQLGYVLVPVPPLVKQSAIADYLDRETARIDALIAAKRRMVELLEEKRRALIARLVTRGLNADTPTRDSGVSWLGQVPAHWEVRRLRRIGRSIIGLTFDPADTTVDDQGVLVLRASNVKDQQIRLDDKLFVRSAVPEILRTRQGDILICARSGSRTLVGKNALIDERSEGLTFGAFMTVFRSHYNRFIFFVLNSPLFDYQAGAFGTSTINQLTSETLNAMEVPFPPKSEQLEIAEVLKEKCAEIDRLRRTTIQSIELIQERRQALITAAVTGQLDIPGAA